MDWPQLLISFRKISPAAMLAAAAAASIVLFGPDELVAGIGLREFRDTYRPWLGSALVASLSILAALVAHGSWDWLQGVLRRRGKRNQLKQYLLELTPREKEYLRPYIIGDQTVGVFEIGDGIAMGLCGKQILYRPSNMARIGIEFEFCMTEQARREVRLRPAYLD
jgi:hypothetical protein